MRCLLLLLALLPCCLRAADGKAAELARKLREISLNVDECYRVRDLSFTKEDVRLYLSEGHLIFGKPLEGAVHSAVFLADSEGGDGEILAFAPTRGERLSLATRTGSPTFDEHFTAAVMIFDDDTHKVLLSRLGSQEELRKSPERGVMMTEDWTPVVRNLTGSFEIRLVRDLLDASTAAGGFFYAALSGRKLGNFDFVYEPHSREQVTIGQLASRDQQTLFDIWTRFAARSSRTGAPPTQAPGFRVSNYRIDATLGQDLSMKVVTKVTVTPARRLRALEFDLSRQMQVTEALIDGKPAEVFQRESIRSNLIQGKEGDDVFLVVPAAELQSGRPCEVEFRHEGAVIAEAGNRVYFVGSRANWYPNSAAQFARYDVTFRYPQELDLVAPGDVVEQKTQGALHIVRRRPAAPLRFFGFNLGDYERLEVDKERYSVEVCANRHLEPALRPDPTQVVLVPPATRPGPIPKAAPVVLEVEQKPPSPAARLRILADEIVGAVAFMADRFGPPPLRHITVSPIPGAFGQGFPGLVYLSTLSYLAPEARPKATRTGFEQVFFSEILLSHEAAHQWWGNIVTSIGYQDDWLMEALANYSALLYLERTKGREALESVLAEYKKHLVELGPDGRSIESAGPITWGMRLQSPRSPDAWRRITYEKGSWIMHMLRCRMGDERFLAMLAQLRRRYEYQGLSTQQFQALAAEFLPAKSLDPKLDSFFENWVYSTGIPTLQFRTKVTGKPPAVKVSGTLEQSGAPADFSAQVPVVVQMRTGKPLIQWLETEDQPVSFQLNLRQAPLKVTLDPENSILAIRK